MDHHQRVVAGVEHNAAAAAGDGAALGLWGTVVLTGTCAAAIYRAVVARDLVSIAFVIVSYGALLLLLRYLRAYEYELAPPEPAVGREGIRRRVWALCTLLTVMFAWKVGSVMPSHVVAVGVWAAAALTSAAGFVVMFGDFGQQRGQR